MICDKCIKKSVCKLYDGSNITGCIEFCSEDKVEHKRNILKEKKEIEDECPLSAEEIDKLLKDLSEGEATEENENAKQNEDCISRQTVNTLIDELARAISDERCHISRERSTAAIMRDIRHLPPATPKQKTGKWIDNHNGTFTCDQCGYKHSKSKYCPDCGAKMI